MFKNQPYVDGLSTPKTLSQVVIDVNTITELIAIAANAAENLFQASSIFNAIQRDLESNKLFHTKDLVSVGANYSLLRGETIDNHIESIKSKIPLATTPTPPPDSQKKSFNTRGFNSAILFYEYLSKKIYADEILDVSVNDAIDGFTHEELEDFIVTLIPNLIKMYAENKNRTSANNAGVGDE